jgi:aspartyl-tRNA synthetase
MLEKLSGSQVVARQGLGSVIFIELRDCSGIVQLVSIRKRMKKASNAKNLRPEFVAAVEGKAGARQKLSITIFQTEWKSLYKSCKF